MIDRPVDEPRRSRWGELRAKGSGSSCPRGFMIESVRTWKELRRRDRYPRLGSGIETEKWRDGQEGGRKERGEGETLYYWGCGQTVPHVERNNGTWWAE